MIRYYSDAEQAVYPSSCTSIGEAARQLDASPAWARQNIYWDDEYVWAEDDISSPEFRREKIPYILAEVWLSDPLCRVAIGKVAHLLNINLARAIYDYGMGGAL